MYESFIKENKNLYRCPKCMHIPIIKIFSETGNPYIDIKCCELKNKLPILDFISEYQNNINKCSHIKFDNIVNICTNCKKLFCSECNNKHLNEFKLHSVYESIFFDFKCNFHNEYYIGYCKGCEINICNKCFISHKKHQIKLFKDYLVSQEKLNKIKTDFLKAKNNMEFLYNLRNEIIKLSHDKILIEQIQNSSNSFYNKNNILSSLLLNIFSMYEKFEKNPNYQIIFNLNTNTNFNLKQININISNYKTSIEPISSYLKNIYFNSILKNPIFSCNCNKTKYQEISKMKTVKLINSHTSGISFLLILKDKRLASTSNDGLIIIYENTNLKPQIRISAHSDWIISLYQFKNGFLVSCSRDSTFKVWQIGTLTYNLMSTIKCHTSCVDAIIELSNNDYATCSFDKSIKIWDISPNMEFTCKKIINYCDPLKQMIEINKCLINNVFDHSIHFLSIENNYDEVAVIRNIDCWSTNGMKKLNEEKFAVGGYKFIHIINGVNKQIEAQIFAHDEIIWCVVLLKDGTLLSSGNDKSIKQWNLNTYECISEKKKAHENGIITIAELPDGRIATGSLAQNDIRIWK